MNIFYCQNDPFQVPPSSLQKATSTAIDLTGRTFKSNGTTSMPKSVPRLMLDKVRLMFLSEMFCSS